MEGKIQGRPVFAGKALEARKNKMPFPGLGRTPGSVTATERIEVF